MIHGMMKQITLGEVPDARRLRTFPGETFKGVGTRAMGTQAPWGASIGSLVEHFTCCLPAVSIMKCVQRRGVLSRGCQIPSPLQSTCQLNTCCQVVLTVVPLDMLQLDVRLGADLREVEPVSSGQDEPRPPDYWNYEYEVLQTAIIPPTV